MFFFFKELTWKLHFPVCERPLNELPLASVGVIIKEHGLIWLKQMKQYN